MATTTAITPHGEGSTNSASRSAIRKSTPAGYSAVEGGYSSASGSSAALGATSRERRHSGLEVDELEVHHLGRVALALAQPDDACVSARAVREPGSHVGEQLVHDVIRAKRGERLPPGMEIAALAQGDHLLGEWLDRLRLSLGRLDPAVLDQGPREIRVERFAVGGIPPELLAGSLVPHDLRRAPRPSA